MADSPPSPKTVAASAPEEVEVNTVDRSAGTKVNLQYSMFCLKSKPMVFNSRLNELSHRTECN